MIDSLALNNIQLLWILIFLILSIDIKKYWQTKVKPQWNRKAGTKLELPKLQYNSLARMNTSLYSKNKKELAQSLMMEICRDAAIFFNTSMFYFLHLRKKPKELEKYFDDAELRSFLISPDIWVKAYVRRNHGLIRRMNHNTIDQQYIEELERILNTFTLQLIERRNQV